jgi:hypothetical protein
MDGADLQSNRRGILGPGQRRRLEETLHSLEKLGDYSFLGKYKQDLADGHVLAVDGEVEFDAREITAAATDTYAAGRPFRIVTACQAAYSARTNGQPPLNLALDAMVLPGPYRLYVGRRMQRILLDVQQMSEATIAENRRGRMTKEQQQTLASMPKSFVGFAFAIMAVILAGATYMQVTHALAKSKSLIQFPIVATALMTLVLLVLLPSMWAEQRKSGPDTQADAEERRLISHAGAVRKKFGIRRNSVQLTLVLGEHECDVSEKPALFAAVVEGQPYRAWVAPRSGHLIALEFVERAAKG